MTERQQRHRHQLHVLHRERKANDRQCKEQRQYQVHDGEFEPRQDDPDDVHDQCNRTARRFGVTHLASEWRDDATGEPEAHKAEWNTDDREAQQDATEDVSKEDYEPTENEEHEIAEQ